MCWDCDYEDFLAGYIDEIPSERVTERVSQTGNIVIRLVEISKEMHEASKWYYGLPTETLLGWADEIEELALEIGLD